MLSLLEFVFIGTFLYLKFASLRSVGSSFIAILGNLSFIVCPTIVLCICTFDDLLVGWEIIRNLCNYLNFGCLFVRFLVIL